MCFNYQYYIGNKKKQPIYIALHIKYIMDRTKFTAPVPRPCM